ncbi:hypothetical protein [Paenibacillus sp. FSL L8-0463]
MKERFCKALESNDLAEMRKIPKGICTTIFQEAVIRSISKNGPG